MRTFFVVVMALILSASMLCAQTPPQPTETPKAPAPAKTPEAAKPAEAPPAPVKATIVGEIAVKTIPAVLVASVRETASADAPKDGYKAGMEGVSDAYKAMMMHGFEKLGAWIHAGNKVAGPSQAFFYEDPTKVAAKDLTCKICFPTDASAKGSDIITIETLPEEKCAVVQYKGSYEMSEDAWNAIDKWVKEHNFVPAGAPSEVYLKGPADGVAPAEYLTEIHMPVQPAEMKKDEPKK